MKREVYFRFQDRQYFVSYGIAWRLVRGGWFFWLRERYTIAGTDTLDDSYRLYVGPLAIEAYVLPLQRRAG